MARQNVDSGRPWESSCGFSRAVRIGNVVEVSLTTASAPDGTILFPDDVYEQTRESLRMIKTALEEAGASLEDVIKTRTSRICRAGLKPAALTARFLEIFAR